jgi:hypothetical protein
MSYVILRGHWCDIIVLNVHVPTEDEIDYMKDNFYEELEYEFHRYPKYHIVMDLSKASLVDTPPGAL